MSPPVDPSSLMSPPIKAMFFPSGDQRTLATCIEGFAMRCGLPDDGSMLNNSAMYQLSSPGPGAARYARLLLSGDQSNSYTYTPAGETARTSPVPEFTNASRCKTICDATTPV